MENNETKNIDELKTGPESIKINLLASTRDFRIEDKLPFFEVPPFIITNDRSIPIKFIDNNFTTSFGTTRINQIFEPNSFGFNQFNFMRLNKDLTIQAEINLLMKMSVDNLGGFFSFLWFIKDCSSHYNTVFMNYPGANGAAEVTNYEPYTSSDGVHTIQTFTNSELLKVLELVNAYKNIIGKNAEVRVTDFPDDMGSFVWPSSLNRRKYNETTRIERAMMFLNIARASGFIVLKISMYVPLLETLFSLTNETEISHKISERCAIYLGGSKDEKSETYKIIKDAYDIRSKFLHGATLQKKDSIETQITISQKTDSIVRRILTKIILEDSSIFNEKDLETFFREALFSQ